MAEDGNPALPAGLRVFSAFVVLVLVIGAGLFLVPDLVKPRWPWPLTPLTARVLGAVLAMYGTVWLAVAVHHTWAGARIPLQAQTIGLAFLLVAVARGEDVVDWGNPLAIVIVAVAAVMLVVSALLSRRAT